MALFTEENASNILTRMLAQVDVKYDKRNGSVIFTSNAPTAEELAIVYKAFDYVLDQALPDTAIREFLIRHCKARNITPYPATKAIVIGRFAPADIALTKGTRFNCGAFYYTVTGKITSPGSVIDSADTENYCYYYLECETEGAEPNGTTGIAIPEDNIDNLKAAEILEVAIHGENEEETEDLRNRFYDSFGVEAYGGNTKDLKNKILSMQGVAGVKIYRAYNGGGTVLAVISATGNIKPSVTLVETVQGAIDPDVIDPEEQWGLGDGLAAIGQHITITGASEETINIKTHLTLQSGITFSDVKSAIREVVSGYFAELNAEWMHNKNTVVRLAEINSRILAIEHVIDISSTELNGKKGNIICNSDSLAVLGTVTDYID